MDEVTNIHDALAQSVVNKQKSKRDPKENITVRLDPKKKEELKRICEVQGTSPSDFFRACADALLRDYMGAKQFEQFEKTASD